MRRTLPVALAFVIGVIMIVEYFFKIDAVKFAGEQVRSWVVLASAFALGLGVVNLGIVHKRRLDQKAKGWQYSVVLIVSFVVTALIGLSQGPQSKTYMFIFNSMLTAPGSTMYAMLAFFIASASYRSFRARNAQAAVLLVSALIVMLGRVPIGEVISSFFPKATAWIMAVPNVAGQRGIMIASSLGYIAVSLKIILGYNRDYLGGKD